jgi:membrane-bound metal-dependent hydrolase YbcI (DUF457 family)
MVLLDPSLISDRRKHGMVAGAAFVFGSLADADFLVAHFTTIPFLRHHYFSHSIPFALLFTALCWVALKLVKGPAAGNWARLFGAAYASHLGLDYLTRDGSFPYGIPLLWPLTDEHFVAPVQFFYSIHRGTWRAIFGPENLLAITVEIAIMLPVALIAFWIARTRTTPTDGARLAA